MPYSIAFVGYDGSGKTTLIDNLSKVLRARVVHINNLSRHLYRHQHSPLWEQFNLYEIILRNKWVKILNTLTPVILDRCYICALVYSNIEGFPSITHRIKEYSFHPDVICLLEPTQEILPKANSFIIEYHNILLGEGYMCFDVKAYPFGQMTFWKCPEICYSPLVEAIVDLVGSISWQPPSSL